MRLFYYFCLLAIVLQLFAAPCFAQYYFKHYQVEDGLSHNSVRSIIQDKKGLIWVGTRGGLSRFDGYTFKTYKNKKNKFGNIGNNVITVIAEDQKGMLWIGTGKGVFRYNPYTEVFTQIHKDLKGFITHILVDGENNLWFVSNYSLFRYNQKKNKITDFKMPASCIALDKDMNLWVGNEDGVLSIYNSKNKLINTSRVIDRNIQKNLRSISKILPIDKNEALIGCFKQGLKSYNRKTGETKTLPLSKSKNLELFVRDITEGANKNYWIATESGIYIYNLTTKTSTNLYKRIGDPYSLSDNAIYTICKDNKGGMWAGTFFGGINYYSRDNAKFKKYYPIPGVNSISGSAVREICSDGKGNLWIGTEDAGVNKFELKTKKFTNYTSSGKREEVSYPNIHGLLALGNKLFIGPFVHGLEIMDTRTGLITQRFKVITDKNNNTSDFVLSIYLTKDSTLLIGTAYGGSSLFSYNWKDKTFKRIPQIPYNSYVLTILEDSKGNIWTGSINQGAYYYNPKTGKKGNIRFGDKNMSEFPVYGILEDSSHNMWFTTEGGGLIKVSPNGQILKKFTTEDGLPSNIVFRILEDDDGNLWISSLKGLICFNTQTEKLKVYTQSNGLITNQFNYNSAYKGDDGKMYFGSVAGMIAFNPTDLEQHDFSPPTYITEFEINNVEITPDESDSPLKKSIVYTDTVTLLYNENNFSIKFSALNYSSPNVTRYKYRMDGLDKEWTYLNTNRNAYFTDLSPGEYTFLVQAESNVGNWVGKERRLYIKILPPLWKSNIAYFIYILALGTLLYVSIRYYHRSLERKNANKLKLFEHEKVKEIYQAKIEFFTNIAHEIQTPLTLISVPVERVIDKIDEYPRIKRSMMMIEKNTKRLVDLISQLLDFRQTEIEQFGLNFVNVDINKILKELIAPFKELATENKIDLELNLPQKHVIAFVDREALVKICSNLVSNAIKYGASKTIIDLIPADPNQKQFTIRFFNDGVAIPEEFRKKIFEPFFRLRRKEKPGTGIGLPLAKSLTELHKGSLELISGENNNIIFELTLPIHQEIEFQLNSWKKIK